MVISNNQKIANNVIKYFDTILPKLGSKIPKDIILASNYIEELVLKALHKIQRHPSILAFKKSYKALNIYFSSARLSSLQNEFKS